MYIPYRRRGLKHYVSARRGLPQRPFSFYEVHIKLMPNFAATNTRFKIRLVATERWSFLLCLVGSEAIPPTMKHELYSESVSGPEISG